MALPFRLDYVTKLFVFHCGAKLSKVPKCPLFIVVPNCPLFIAVPNCPPLHCSAKLSWCQNVLVPKCPRCQSVLFYIAVPNCPGAKLSWYQIVLGAKLSSFTLRCQIVLVSKCSRCHIILGANLSSFTLECQIVLVPKCHRCQIVIVQITCLRPKVKIWSGPLKGLFLSHGISLVFENKSFGTFGNQVWWFGQASPSNSSPWKFILEISAGSY